MKKIKKFFMLVLVICLIFTSSYIDGYNNITSNIFSIFTTNCYAATSDFEIKNNVLIKYKGNSSYVTIPSSVKVIGEGAFQGNGSVLSVTIPKGVTTIKKSAFAATHNLTNISMPNTLTKIEELAFFGSYIKTIYIPKSVKYIGDNAFTRSNLERITVDSNNKKYTSINGSLFNKSKTKLIQYAIGKSNTSYTVPSTVTEIGVSAFADSSLEHIYLPKSLKKISDAAFSMCGSLKSLKIPEGVKKLPAVFGRCRDLEYVQIPRSVTYIEKDSFNLGTGTFVDGGTRIKGYKGSYAESFAKKYKIKFVPLNNESVKVSAIKILKNTSSSSSSVSLSWSKLSNVTGYKVYRSKSKDGKYTLIKTISNKSINTYTDKKLSKKTKYYYKVRAYKTVGKTNYYGSYSSVILATTK